VEKPPSPMPFAKPSPNDPSSQTCLRAGKLVKVFDFRKIWAFDDFREIPRLLLQISENELQSRSGSGSSSHVVNKGNDLGLTNANPFLLA
jgi:hypothetical protein